MSARVIDAHTHLYSSELAPPYWYRAMADYGSKLSGRPAADVLRTIEEEWFDPRGDRLIADMDAAGIEKSVVFLLDFGLFGGVDDGVSMERRYELMAEAVRAHPDRLVFFGGIDPVPLDHAGHLDDGGVAGFELSQRRELVVGESYWQLFDRVDLVAIGHKAHDVAMNPGWQINYS